MKKQKCSSLLNTEEIIQIFQTGSLFEKGSFHFIERNDASYDVNRDKNNFIEESKLLHRKFQEGHTIIVKNLEGFNEAIRIKAATVGHKTDVHMYLVPTNAGPSFSYHHDTRDVLIHMIYGEKIFWIKEPNSDTEVKHHLYAGDELFLPMSHMHRADPLGASCLLSFGKKIQKVHYEIPTFFKESDFHKFS